MNDSIIVYRSRSEQLIDGAWWSLVESNPEAFLLLYNLFILAIISTVVWFFSYTIYHLFHNRAKRSRKRSPYL